MGKFRSLVTGGLALLALIMVWFAWGWYGAADFEKDTRIVIKDGASLTSVAGQLEEEGLISSSKAFLRRAKIFGSKDAVQRGEFLITVGMSPSEMLYMFQGGDVVRRYVTIPEGMPSVMVYDRLMANDMLVGEIPVPVEGSVLPDTYEIQEGEERSAVLARMQAAMQNYLAEAWPRRSKNTVVSNVKEAVILASIVEKETAKAEERPMVAGLYSNRVRKNMFLQADPTIIYPITKGKPLGRRIRQSEISDINDYNTYSMVGLPKGPITNPGRESIAAVLSPATTEAIYMVADGSGGHEFNTTLEGHQAAVDRWFELRRKKGEM